MSLVWPMALIAHEKTRTPTLRNRSVVVSLTEDTRGHDEVRRVVDQRLEHDGDLGRIVLPVGVQRDDELRAELDAERVADAQGVAVPEVLAQDEGHRAGVLGDLVGLVAAAVDHDEGGHRQAAGLRGHGGQDGADVVLFLVGADEAHDRGELHVGIARVELLA